ncbi:MAG: non-ribosomal peptide synthetase, partial [Flavobacteriaceae bacterium]
DDQVKIRGYRIELGEIESCLSGLEGVQQSAVIVKGKRDSKHLIAYVSCSDLIDKDSLEESLKALLPDYMVPRIYVFVDGFKLNSSGKIDKINLPTPGLEDYSVTEYVAPETDLEKDLTKVWMDVLGLERVGTTDNFFALGGHSLLAMKLVTKIESEINMKLKIKTIYLYPTIKELSEILQTQVDSIIDLTSSEDINEEDFI